ncbi:hypothetical protein F5148DRAFT_1180575 [Russula earlei]|uniref:Uncharacterized protein n=1 Tax=Russula earlei TaxID=71964 RepID=A0ACC0UGD2_9AGAM|nr:hypothetical protein F5148DRAFT_1180575 [Russula earlei]
MVDWHSPSQLARDARKLILLVLSPPIHLQAEAFSNLIHVLFGLYLWEFCISFDFDHSFISGKRKYRWPLVTHSISSVVTASWRL